MLGVAIAAVVTAAVAELAVVASGKVAAAVASGVVEVVGSVVEAGTC